MARKPRETSAADFLPERRSLAAVRKAARGCRGCHLWRSGTQTVFGEGLRRSRLMVVGEIAGDEEDRAGKPFVGPAGRELDRALEEVGIDRRETYVTNVVKHFKWIPRGKRRLHQRPDMDEIDACMPWLETELELVRPRVLLLLGATAAKVLLGSHIRVTRDRGRFVPSELAPFVTATVHPSSILRKPDREDRAEARRRFVEDLRQVERVLDGGG